MGWGGAQLSMGTGTPLPSWCSSTTPPGQLRNPGSCLLLLLQPLGEPWHGQTPATPSPPAAAPTSTFGTRRPRWCRKCSLDREPWQHSCSAGAPAVLRTVELGRGCEILALCHRETLPKGKQGRVCLFSGNPRRVWLGRELRSIPSHPTRGIPATSPAYSKCIWRR